MKRPKLKPITLKVINKRAWTVIRMTIVSALTAISSCVIYNWNTFQKTLMPIVILLTLLIFSYQKKVVIQKANARRRFAFIMD